MADWVPVVETDVAGAYVPDLDNSRNFDLTLSGDMWLDVSANTVPDGDIFMFTFRDPTGECAIGWNAETGPQWFLTNDAVGFPTRCVNGIPFCIVMVKTPHFFVLLRTISSCNLNLS